MAEQLKLFNLSNYWGRLAIHPWEIKERMAEKDIERILRFGWCKAADWYDTPGMTPEWAARFGLIDLGQGAYCVGRKKT